MKVQIIPAILEEKTESIVQKISLLNKGQLIHLDVLDQTFLPRLKTAQLEEALLILSEFQLELHFMTSQPERYIKKLSQNVTAVILHQDCFQSSDEMKKAISLFKENKIAVGLTTSPQNTLRFTEGIKSYQIMGVIPGKSGQKFLQNTVMRVLKLRQSEEISGMMISVDGGVSDWNYKQLIEAGATKLVMNSALWSKPNAQNFLNEVNSLNSN